MFAFFLMHFGYSYEFHCVLDLFVIMIRYSWFWIFLAKTKQLWESGCDIKKYPKCAINGMNIGFDKIY